MLTTADKQTNNLTARQFTSEPRKITLEELQNVVDWMAQRPDVPASIVNGLTASLWLSEVRAFRDLEEQLMLEGKYDAALPDHKVRVLELIADGERIVRATKTFGIDAPFKFTIDDLISTLESLHTTFRGEHGPKNSQKTNELISQLFDVSKSRD